MQTIQHANNIKHDSDYKHASNLLNPKQCIILKHATVKQLLLLL